VAEVSGNLCRRLATRDQGEPPVESIKNDRSFLTVDGGAASSASQTFVVLVKTRGVVSLGPSDDIRAPR
jgi:hypothetical protein